MVRTIVTPENNLLSLSIPNSYVGKKIEVLYYAVDEVEEEAKPVKTNTMAHFKGILSEEEANQLQEYVKKSREEWDRGF
jgi:hypothetical protein